MGIGIIICMGIGIGIGIMPGIPMPMPIIGIGIGIGMPMFIMGIDGMDGIDIGIGIGIAFVMGVMRAMLCPTARSTSARRKARAREHVFLRRSGHSADETRARATRCVVART
jgi:hypothetical protein